LKINIFHTILFFFILCFGFNQVVFAQYSSNGFEGLSEIYIVVEKLNSELKDVGLTEKQIKDDVELKLRRIEIYKPSTSASSDFDELLKSLSDPYIYINITSLEIDRSSISYTIRVSLFQNVKLQRNDKITATASTWNNGSIGIVSKTRASLVIRESLSEHIDEFINDWKEANNKNAKNKVKSSNTTPESKQSPLKNNDSPFKAIYVGGNRPPEVEVFNDSDRTLYLDLGQNKLIPYTIPPKTSKTFNLTDGFYNFKATAPRVVPLEGQQEFKTGYKYSWRFTIVKYTVPR
jgi:hypothetical protein